MKGKRRGGKKKRGHRTGGRRKGNGKGKRKKGRGKAGILCSCDFFLGKTPDEETHTKHTQNRQTDRQRDSGGATPWRARSNDLAGISTALAPPCLLLCLGNSVNSK